MRKMNLMLLAALVVFIAACGGKGGTETQIAEETLLKTEVQASNLKDFASFPEDVKIKLSSKKSEKEDEVNLVLAISLDVNTTFCGDGNAWNFDLSIVDQDYAELLKWDVLQIDTDTDYDNDEEGGRFFFATKGIQRKSVEKTISIQDWERICKNGAFLIISNSSSHAGYMAYTGSSSSTSNDEGSSSSTSNDESSSSTADDDSGSEDWDSILDSYENYVDKYISLAKKAASGDVNALSEYAELAKEAQELSSKLSKAQSELSSSQLSRYTKITQKMANAAK